MGLKLGYHAARSAMAALGCVVCLCAGLHLCMTVYVYVYMYVNVSLC